MNCKEIDENQNGFESTNGCKFTKTKLTVLSKDSPSQTSVSYEEVEEISKWLLSRTKYRPKVAVVCGSGLSGLASSLQERDEFDYKDIQGFPVSTVVGHVGRLVFGKIGDTAVLAMQGRLHAYEGYPMSKITLPVRVMKLIGVEIMIATNAAGGLNPSLRMGDVVLLKDHINLPGLVGNNPLMGPNDERWGSRFPSMSDAYDRPLRELAARCARELHFDFVREGVYFMGCGPCYETIAECRLLHMLGADVTGMSTVPEVVVAHHCGIRCLALSLVTNECVLEYADKRVACHEEVLETGRQRSTDIQKLVESIVKSLQK